MSGFSRLYDRVFAKGSEDDVDTKVLLNDGRSADSTRVNPRVREGWDDESSTGGGLHGMLGGVYRWWKGDDDEDGENEKDRGYDRKMEEDDYESTPRWEDHYMDDPPDQDIGDTMNLIRETEKRWMDEEDTRDLLNVDYRDKKGTGSDDLLEQLLKRIENNNETLMKMIDNFDNATFKADYRNVKAENKELSRKYHRLRKEYREEIQETRKIHGRYRSLVRKYKERIEEQGDKDEMKKKDARIEELGRRQVENDREMARLQESNDRLLKERVKNTRENQDSVLYYKNQYEEMHLNFLTKSKEEKMLRVRIEELEDELRKKDEARVSYTSELNLPPLDPEAMNTVELLRRKFEDKTYDDTEIDMHISKPMIEDRKASK